MPHFSKIFKNCNFFFWNWRKFLEEKYFSNLLRRIWWICTVNSINLGNFDQNLLISVIFLLYSWFEMEFGDVVENEKKNIFVHLKQNFELIFEFFPSSLMFQERLRPKSILAHRNSKKKLRNLHKFDKNMYFLDGSCPKYVHSTDEQSAQNSLSMLQEEEQKKNNHDLINKRIFHAFICFNFHCSISIFFAESSECLCLFLCVLLFPLRNAIWVHVHVSLK